MMRTGRVFATLAVLACSACPTFAQDAGKIGLAMAYPAAFGIVWHATDKIAIRPSVTFGGSSTEGSATTSGGSAWNVGTTIAALFYVKKYDNVRTYISPSYRYSHTSTTIHPPSASASLVGDLNSTANTNGGAGTFGAEFAATTHFSIIGEVGFAFSRVTQKSMVVQNVTVNGKSWGATAGVGLVFYP